MNTWQPIETAPENTNVIVWDPSAKDFYKAWSDNWNNAEKYGQPREWYHFDSLSGEGVSRCFPTHWMLPEPPDT